MNSEPKKENFFKKNLLMILTLVGVLSGIGLGFFLRWLKTPWEPRNTMYITFSGDIYLRMLKCLIIPLIVSSLITAIGSLDISLSKKIGLRAIVYYIVTTLIASILGMILVTIIKPGKKGIEIEITGEGLSRNTTTTVTEVLYDKNKPDLDKNEMIVKSSLENGTNMLGLITFSIVMGITLVKMGEKGKPLLDLFICLSEATLSITKWVLFLSPIGVCSLIAGQLIIQKNINQVMSSLGMYVATFMSGLFIHGLIVLPLIYTLMTRENPVKFMFNMMPAMISAFGSASSTATVPITLECAEKNNKIDPRVSRFIIPIGATINMDAVGMYQSTAAIFIGTAQILGRDLSFGNMIIISLTSLAASWGTAAIPQGGLITMVMVFSTLGFPAEYISYIVPVDWISDRFRTAVNVLGDAIGAGIVNHMSKKELEKFSISPNGLA